MYLGTLYVILDLEPEVTSTDRERILRKIRDRLRQAFSQRVTIRTDDEDAIAIALFDNSYGAVHARLDDITEHIENLGEARLSFSTPQVFRWYDGMFRSTDSPPEDLAACGTDDAAPRARGRNAGNPSSTNGFKRYHQDEDEQGFTPIPTRFGRRGSKTPGRRQGS